HRLDLHQSIIEIARSMMSFYRNFTQNRRSIITKLSMFDGNDRNLALSSSKSIKRICGIVVDFSFVFLIRFSTMFFSTMRNTASSMNSITLRPS
ncbi:hypothetical protein PENTCL1PPCAC_944, partial [Pristionchus entomophagus]